MSIRMVGQEDAPQASANVFMNPRTRSALVFFNHLPATGPEKSYQLWVIRADQPAPQSAGTFEVGSEGKATLAVENLPVNTEIKAFALTLEPRGGVNAPTGPKYLIGS
jgi:anti-sigma-K factor RskA